MSTETTRVKTRSLSAGPALLQDPTSSKGTAVTAEERGSLGVGEVWARRSRPRGVSNWRWRGVRNYAGTGKALRRRRAEPPVTEAVIRFKDARITWELDRRAVRAGTGRPQPRQQPPRPRAAAPRPRELFADVLEGDHSVFPGPREIERSWQIVDALLRAWERDGRPLPYARGSCGPPEADALVGRDWGAHWLRPARSRA